MSFDTAAPRFVHLTVYCIRILYMKGQLYSSSVLCKCVLCAVLSAAVFCGCSDDSDKNGDNVPANTPECTSNQQCADRLDNKIECDQVSQLCVIPSSNKAKCGNGTIDGADACDGDDLNNKSCSDFGFIGGTLACSSTCDFDKSGCFECTNDDLSKCDSDDKCVSGHCVPENIEALCSDNSDNDSDGRTDCDDSDCLVIDSCKKPENTPEACSDALDNDGDGKSDCNDPECKPLDICKTIEINAETCSDREDNDNDGDVDCDDDDCKSLDICKTIEINAETCGDREDNDNDGDVDCKDSDCAAFCSTVDCGDDKQYVAKFDMCAYKLSNADDLISLRDTWNASGAASYNNPGPFFVLTDDIDLGSKSGWTGIGTEDNPFTGVLIGNDKTIRGTLKCSADCGLFDVMYKAVVADLTLSLNVSTSSGAFAGLLATLAQDISAYNMTLSGSVSSAQIAGGLSAIGSGEYKNIADNANVRVNSSAVNGMLSIGGLVGYVVPSTEVKMENIEMDVSVNIYNHFVASDPGVPLRYSGCVLGLMADGHIDMSHANIKCQMSSDIFGDEPDSPCDLMSYLTGYFGGIAASIKASGKIEDIQLDFTPNEILIKGDAFGAGVCTRWVKVSNYFGGFFAEANGLSGSERLELNRVSGILRNAKITASTGADRDYSAPLAGIFNNAVARNFVVDAVSSRSMRSAIAYKIENSSIANFNVANVPFDGINYFEYLNNNSKVVNGYVSGIEKYDDMNVNNYYSILYSSLKSLYVLNSDRKMVDGSAYSASQVVEFFNNTLESKHSSFPSGKYLPWYVDGDGKPSLNFDAADAAMYTIP